jgi:heme exporter protein D
MNWGSAAEFFAMGGYAGYVWGAFAVVAACMIVEPFVVRARRREALRRLRQLTSAAQGAHNEATA